jgi:hypothetical protein
MVLTKVGLQGTETLWALDWSNWGTRLPGPAVGAFAPMKRQGGGHIAIGAAARAGFDTLPLVSSDGRQIARRQGGKLYPATAQKCVATDKDGVRALAHKVCKGGIDLPAGAGIKNLNLHSHAARSGLYTSHCSLVFFTQNFEYYASLMRLDLVMLD